MVVEIGLPSTDATPGRVDELQLAYEQHKTKATKQIDMLKKAEEDGPKRQHIASGWRTICTGKNDFSFFLGLIITKRKS